MAEVVHMPRLSDTMTEGVVAAWHKKIGDTVKSGDLLAEIETDKATMDFEAPTGGVLLYTGAEAGGAIPVGDLMVVIGKAGEDIADLLTGSKGPKAESPAPAVEKAVAPPAPIAPAPAPEPVTEAVAAPVTPESGDRLKASPLAKKLAQEKGINLHQVAGSGENGRIVKRDIETFTPAAQEEAPAAPAHGIAPSVGQEHFEEVRVSQMRKTIAKRLSESKFGAPHFYLTMEIDMAKAIEVRKALNETSPVKVSFNDLVIKACAVALKQHPAVNSSWLGDKIRFNKHIHIGMAVAVDEGLLVPVIRFADQKGLASIAAESKDFAARARDKKLQPADWEGNTFTISNLGMMGIEEFTAIINPPDAAILAVGAIIEKPVVKNGQIVIGSTMKVTLSCDHRVVDGMVGSQFLATLRQLIEDPIRMLI